MPWYVAEYRPDGSPIDPKKLPVVRYGSRFWAKNPRHARQVAKKRGIGERVISSGFEGSQDYDLPSEALLRRKKNVDNLYHTCMFHGYLALMSGVATPRQILGDEGLVHEVCHVRNGGTGMKGYKWLAQQWAALERRIPGVLPHDERR